MEAPLRLEINCWLYGEDVDKMFKVTIPRKSEETNLPVVADLKIAVKQERSRKLHGLDANDLDLYSIPFPDDEDLHQTLRQWSVSSKRRLCSATKLSQCLSRDRECLFIVKAPSLNPSQTQRSDVISYLVISCWIRGQETSDIFPVKALPKQTVSDLLLAIMAQGQIEFRGMGADAIKLFAIPYPSEEDIENTLTSWNLKGQSCLNVRMKIEGISDKLIVVVPTCIKLICWVHGEPTNVLFSVRVSKKDTIEEVQKAVKLGRLDVFEGIAAAKIKLYQVDNLNVDEPQSFTQGVAFKDSLLSVRKVSDVFQGHVEGRLHLIVGVPPRDSQKTTSGEVEEEKDVLSALAETFKRTMTIPKSSLTPSKLAKSSEYAKFQAGDCRVLDGRISAENPVDTVAPPIQLFHPAFAHFSSKAFDPAYIVPEAFHRQAYKLMAEFAPIYTKEKCRREKIRPLISMATQRVLTSIVNSDGTSPDFVVQSSNTVLPSYLVVVEEKNEFGDGGSDPSVQASFSYLRLISQPENRESCRRSCCPAFIIAHAGPWLSIMGGVVVDRCIVQRLTDYVWVPLHSTHDDYHSLQIARMLFALKESIALLDAWYQKLDTAVAPYDCTPVFHPRFWPSATTYEERDTDTLVEFTYLRPLESDTTCVTYLAKTCEDNPRDIVVKFVTSYGADAHKHMAMKGFAPQMLYYGEIRAPGMPSFGHLRMVVMDYVKGLTLHEAIKRPCEKIPPSFESDLGRAFKHLHDGGYVFGDLRMPNVMLRILPEGRSESAVQLIDFDWAGKEGEAKYPISINSSAIVWPEGVENLAYIKKRHDEIMLESLLLNVSKVVAAQPMGVDNAVSEN